MPPSPPPKGPAPERPPPERLPDRGSPSLVGPRLLIDTPLGWIDRGVVRDLLTDADHRVATAEQQLLEERRAAEVARHDAEVARHGQAVARYERDRLGGRRVVRVATALADTAGSRTVTSLPARLKAAAAPRPGPPLPAAAPEPLPDLEEPPAEDPPSRPTPRPGPSTSSPVRPTARQVARALDERGLLPPTPRRVPPFPHLRVLHLGVAGRFVSLARHTALTPETWREQLRGGADLVLIEPPADAPAWDPLRGELPQLLRAASESGIPSVRIATGTSAGGSPGEPTVDLVEGRPDTSSEWTIAPSVDTATMNPTGWRAQPPDPVIAVLGRAPDHEGRDLLASFDPPVVLIHPADLPSIGGHLGIRRSVSSPSGMHRALVRAGVLLDHPSWREDPAETLRLWTAALACGTPVVVVDQAAQLGAPLVGPDGEVTLSDGDRLPLLPGMILTSPRDAIDVVHGVLTDPDRRERLGIVGRRHALGEGGRETALRGVLARIGVPVPPSPRTSVLLATNRPHLLERALANVARQNQPRVDVSLVLHGPGFDDVDPPSRDGLVSSVVRAPAHWRLGDCLNAALDHAGGELVAKMDDDDHYGPDHLVDLAAAWGYSGADLVGKRVEFVHLAERGITLRRPASPPERFRPHVGGPTLFGSRETLRRHRFLRLPNRVDSTLYERVLADGGRIYGIHSRDLVLERHGEGHAWSARDEEFLADAVTQRPGLALDLATSDPHSGT